MENNVEKVKNAIKHFVSDIVFTEQQGYKYVISTDDLNTFEKWIKLLKSALAENTPTSSEQCAAPAVSESVKPVGKPTVCLTCKFNKPNNAICDFCNDKASKYSRQTER